VDELTLPEANVILADFSEIPPPYITTAVMAGWRTKERETVERATPQGLRAAVEAFKKAKGR
jgi:hypothetical protein